MKVPKKYTEDDADIHVTISAIRRKCDDYLFDYVEEARSIHAKGRKEHLKELFEEFAKINEICK